MDRAAVFTSSSQAVEVYEQGGWLPATMLGWRHDGDGACSAWVRVQLAGVVEDAWVDLARLRLPEVPARHLTPTPDVRTSTRVAPRDTAPGPGGTQQLSPVRPGDATPVRRRVPPAVGGRRRAPETGELPAAGSAPFTVVPGPAGPAPGRHRAPADLGRHRAADTGVLTAVRAGGTPPSGPGAAVGPDGDRRSAPPPRSELPPAGPVVRAKAGRDPEVEGLTRPMRLDRAVGSVRRSRRDALSV